MMEDLPALVAVAGLGCVGWSLVVEESRVVKIPSESYISSGFGKININTGVKRCIEVI